MNKYIFLLILLFPFKSFAAENVYTIDKPIIEVVRALNDDFAGNLNGGIPDLPVQFFNLDLEMRFFGKPNKHYYHFEVILKKPVGKLWKFEKTLDIWGNPGYTTVKSTIDVGWGRTPRCRLIRNIKERIVNKIESKILCLLEWRVRSHVE